MDRQETLGGAHEQCSSIFGQLLQIFPKNEFYSTVRETDSEKGAKEFTCWGQLVAMLFCQMGQAQSLREICDGLSSCLRTPRSAPRGRALPRRF